MKKYKQGFTLGKFYPFHKGHEYMIRQGVENCENFTVMVCTMDSETIDGDLRIKWIQETFPIVNVVYVDNNGISQYPEDDPENFRDIWTKLIKQSVPDDVDVFYSSEEYGKDVAVWLKIEYEIVDLSRDNYPVSGTAIREDPYSFRHMLPRAVAPYFVKRVAILGPESVGKTVMTQKLADHFKTIGVSEYGRDHADKIGDGEWSSDDFKIIMLQQDFDVEVATHNQATNGVVFSDTEQITTRIFSHMFGYPTEDVIEDQDFDLYLVLTPDVPWVQDGLRKFGGDEVRKEHFFKILQALMKEDKNFMIIGLNKYLGMDMYKDRFESAVYYVEQLLGFLPKA